MIDDRFEDNQGYETKDINIRKVYLFVLLGIFALAAILLALDKYFSYETEREIYDTVLKPESKILTKVRERDQRILSSYGVIDSAAGIYHIPIDSAMKEMLREYGESKGAK